MRLVITDRCSNLGEVSYQWHVFTGPDGIYEAAGVACNRDSAVSAALKALDTLNSQLSNYGSV